MRKGFLAFLTLLIVAPGPAFAETRHWKPPATPRRWGHFDGDIVAKFLADGRIMQLEKPFTYTGPDGRMWMVPAGTTTDGASVPPAFWFAFPPYSGPYRGPAVMHDHYCHTQTRTWRDTHKAFYTAMRAAGVPHTSARALYIAVMRFGPRWKKLNPEPVLDFLPQPRVVEISKSKAKPRAPPKVAQQENPRRSKASNPRKTRTVAIEERPRFIKAKAKPKPNKGLLTVPASKLLEQLFPKATPGWSPHRSDRY
jgi:hypothetical protein